MVHVVPYVYVRGSFDNQERVAAKKSLMGIGGTAGIAIYLFSVSIVLGSAFLFFILSLSPFALRLESTQLRFALCSQSSSIEVFRSYVF